MIGPARRGLLFLAPLPAIALGAWVAAGHGVSWVAFLPNVAACLLGSLAARGLGGMGPAVRERAAIVVPVVAFLGIAATLLLPGIDGVTRWLPLGPLRLNMSAACAPCLFLGFTASRQGVRLGALVLLLLAQLVHLAQPDAAQASALAAGVLPLLAGRLLVGRLAGGVGAAVLLLIAAVAWTRPDALAPLDHVERILWLTAARGAPSWLALLLTGFVLFAPLALLGMAKRPLSFPLASGFACYLAALVVATFFGNFPVPAVGAGAGPVLGWYAMIGVLLASEV